MNNEQGSAQVVIYTWDEGEMVVPGEVVRKAVDARPSGWTLQRAMWDRRTKTYKIIERWARPHRGIMQRRSAELAKDMKQTLTNPKTQGKTT